MTSINKSLRMEELFEEFLALVGEDPNREGLQETPARMVKAWKFWTSGYRENPEEVFKLFTDGGEDYDQMIIVDPIPFYSHCEHHMAAIYGNVHIGYIPDKKIAGLSKFVRLTNVFARRLQVQERLTTQIANTIHKSKLAPLGVGVFIKAHHFCMESRGVQVRTSAKTDALRGIFMDKPVRDEFFELIKL